MEVPKFGFLDFWIFEVWDCLLGNFGFLDFWIFGTLDFWKFGFLDFWNFGFLEFWAPPSPICCVWAKQGGPADSGAAGPLAFYPKVPIPHHPLPAMLAPPLRRVCPLVGISKHWGANSTLLADTQKPQPQLGQNVQALRPGLRQTLQP